MSRPRRRRPTTTRPGSAPPNAPAAPAQQNGSAPGAGAGRNNGQGQGQRRNRAAAPPKVPRGLDLAAAQTLITPAATVRPSDAPDAVVRSLGAPPLPGHEVAAEHYFAAVYERSVALATALASAAGLLDDSDDTLG